MPIPQNARLAVVAMSIGLALTVTVTAVPFFGSPVGELIFRHVEAGYPSYSVSATTTATMIYLVGLTVVGLIGAACWIVSLTATRASKRWAPEIATVALVLAASVGLFDLMVRDTSGDTGLPTLVGFLGLLPCIPGAFAVVVLWIEPPARKPGVGSASY